MQNYFGSYSFSLMCQLIYLGPEVKIGLITEGREAGTLDPGKWGVDSRLIATGSEVQSSCPQGAWSSSDSTPSVVDESISLRLRRGL